ncbi:unnamed protein product [Gongylonema pulchrum]|uniref:Alpha-xylosidase n=1 Tax=Gongylonema pulchrum TaxID=637853 RepID=A0A183D2Z3_9BILA|nr:unnamed protein product [Gongylonema pulchrum]
MQSSGSRKLSVWIFIPNNIVFLFKVRAEATILSYTIYAAKRGTLSAFHVAVHDILYEPCTDLPDEAMMRKPIWSTWARYKVDIDQQKLLQFAQEILKNEAPICQVELDDRWATHYGDFEFDKSKFPDVEGMCKQLEEWNIRLTLWVHPFVNLDSNNGKNPDLKELFVKDWTGEPGIVEWWQGAAYVVDFTNPIAVEWFCEQLEGLRKHGIFSFKFDAGEVIYLPTGARLHNDAVPLLFTRNYVLAAATFGTSVEARVFSHTQQLPIFYRTQDRFSTWNNIGLDTLIPVALNFGLHGYYYNLPDMIGGNGYGGSVCGKELYIRWMQVMPSSAFG